LRGERVRSGFEISPESIFLPTVQREIRRTERSGRPFLLVLIRTEAFQGANGTRVTRAVGASLEKSIRETDWFGWYESNRTLGVVLTEIGEATEAQVAFLKNKLSVALQKALGSQELRNLRLIIRLYPRHATWKEAEGWDEDVCRDVDVASGRRKLVAKRALDVVGSLFGILIFLPLILAIAVILRLTSEGPVIHRQKRVGQYGQLFDFYKFRSMRDNSDPRLHREYMAQMIEGGRALQSCNGMYKLDNDPRVTSLGKLLRKTSLDELPQFLNVLRGDISLVGPRPPLPYEFERYRMWHRRRVLETKPGLTGLWQVKGRSRTTFDEMVRMDIRYAQTSTIWTDLQIICQTPVAMLSRTGAS
jgi:lipopolysaccharide/colanic/teichoic acid biosynthesis glycosyltransferase